MVKKKNDPIIGKMTSKGGRGGGHQQGLFSDRDAYTRSKSFTDCQDQN